MHLFSAQGQMLHQYAGHTGRNLIHNGKLNLNIEDLLRFHFYVFVYR